MSAYAPIEVGVEAYIVRNEQLLLGKRSHKKFGAGTWGLPGGRVEFMERADAGILRELKEELGLSLPPSSITMLALTDDPQPGHNQHHLHITFRVDPGDHEPTNAEPDECDEIRWFPLDALPDNIFPPHRKIFATIKSGRAYDLQVPESLGN